MRNCASMVEGEAGPPEANLISSNVAALAVSSKGVIVGVLLKSKKGIDSLLLVAFSNNMASRMAVSVLQLMLILLGANKGSIRRTNRDRSR